MGMLTFSCKPVGKENEEEGVGRIGPASRVGWLHVRLLQTVTHQPT